MSGRKNRDVHVYGTSHPVELHLLRQVHVPSGGILHIHRGDHNALPHHQLILHPDRRRIIRPHKGERVEHHLIPQSRLHKLTVNVRQEGVAEADDVSKIFRILKLVELLLPGAQSRVVSHQRCKDPQFQPAKQQIFGGIPSEASQIRTGIKEAGHVQGWKHLEIKQDMGPPGLVVSHPDSPVTVHAHTGGPGKEQDPLIGRELCKGFPGCPGHVCAVEVVNPVMAYGLSMDVVGKGPVVLRTVGHV